MGANAKIRNIISWNRIEGNWKQFEGMVKETSGELTDDELEQIACKHDMHLGKIQEKYRIARNEAEKCIEDFENAID